MSENNQDGINTFDELCKMKDKLDKAALEIGKKARSINQVILQAKTRLGKEKFGWLNDDSIDIMEAGKVLSEICGDIEFLKTWHNPQSRIVMMEVSPPCEHFSLPRKSPSNNKPSDDEITKAIKER